MWLHKNIYQSYDVEDWNLMPEASEIEYLVNNLRSLAATTTDHIGPTKEVFEEAAPKFSRLHEIMRASK